MDNSLDQEPVELQKEFGQTLDEVARRDEEGTLECVSHDTLMRELDEIFSAIRDNIEAFEKKNPHYATRDELKLD